MRFLLDENTSKSTASFLTQLGHTVFRIKEISPGAEDIKILKLAVEKEASLITLDKDFGELIFKKDKSHKGVFFLRLDDQSAINVIEILKWLLLNYSEDKLENNFVTVIGKEEKFKVRFKK